MNRTLICALVYAIVLGAATASMAGDCAKCDAGKGKGKGKKHHHSKHHMKECVPHPEQPHCASIPYEEYCYPCLSECYVPPKLICKEREFCPPVKCDLPFCRYPAPPPSHKHHHPPYCEPECGKGGKKGACCSKPFGLKILAREK